MATRLRTYLIQGIGLISRAFSLPASKDRPSPRLTALFGTLPEGLAGVATFVLRRFGPVLTIVLLGAVLLGKETVKDWWTWTELLSKPGVASVLTQL